MSEAPQEEVLTALERVLGDRIVRSQAREGGSLATVSPTSAEEVELVAKTAARYSVALHAQGAGTGPETGVAAEGSILLRFDLMRGLRMPERGEPWVDAGPGASWLELDDNLSVSGLGLAVYPTSAPRATVGGWLAQDGLGVGSFEYGWLHENVLSAAVVLPGGERLTVKGDELRSVVRPESGEGIVVGARLRTRSADDLPYALEFSQAEELVRATEDILGLPLWHLGLLNAEMAKARSLGDGHLLFGAYPKERSSEIEDSLRAVASSHGGRILSPADAYRAWGERFFPVAPSHPTPVVTDRLLMPLDGVGEALEKLSARAVQGTVARSSEVLVLALDANDDGRAP
jgi:FAD/FMN-containing dehydrogenase